MNYITQINMRVVNEALERKLDKTEGEKVKLLLEFKTLTSSIDISDSTTEDTNKVKGEMNKIVNNSTAEVRRQQSALPMKEEAISELKSRRRAFKWN